MAESDVQVRVDDEELVVPAGTTVAAAIARSRAAGAVRRSVDGELRGPLCGMGTCFECRATVDGRRHRRTCMVVCRDGMEVRTDA